MPQVDIILSFRSNLIAPSKNANQTLYFLCNYDLFGTKAMLFLAFLENGIKFWKKRFL